MCLAITELENGIPLSADSRRVWGVHREGRECECEMNEWTSVCPWARGFSLMLPVIHALVSGSGSMHGTLKDLWVEHSQLSTVSVSVSFSFSFCIATIFISFQHTSLTAFRGHVAVCEHEHANGVFESLTRNYL